MRSCWGPRIRSFAKSPHQTVAVLERHWMSVDYLDASFQQDFSVSPAISLMQWTSLDVLERYWMVGRVATTFST